MTEPFINQVERTPEAQKAGIQQVLDMVQVAVNDGRVRSVACVYVDKNGTRYHRFMVCHADVDALQEGLTDIIRVVNENEEKLRE